MRKLKQWWKRLGKGLVARVYVEVPRQLNGLRIRVPVIEGRKIGVKSEPWMSGLLKRLMAVEKGTFLDVGVNLGQTLAKVKTLEPERVYAGFEPSPFCQHYVGRLIALNSWTRVTICPCALFDREMLLPMSGASEGAASATLISELRPEEEAAVTLVPAFRFDVVKAALPPGSIGIIKIDVEGAEVEVIRSLKGIIGRDQPVITLEVLPVQGETGEFRAKRNGELRSLLEGLGYVMHVVRKTSDDTFAGVEVDLDFGTGSDARSKDYVAVPKQRIEEVVGVLREP